MTEMLHFNVYLVINNGTFTDLSGGFGLQVFFIRTQSAISKRRNSFMFLNSVTYWSF